jgi:hypothetical protein
VCVCVCMCVRACVFTLYINPPKSSVPQMSAFLSESQLALFAMNKRVTCHVNSLWKKKKRHRAWSPSMCAVAQMTRPSSYLKIKWLHWDLGLLGRDGRRNFLVHSPVKISILLSINLQEDIPGGWADSKGTQLA